MIDKNIIKSKIDSYNELIADSMEVGSYALNKTVANYIKEIRQLQKECEKTGHQFEGKQCIYCYKLEGEHN